MKRFIQAFYFLSNLSYFSHESFPIKFTLKTQTSTFQDGCMYLYFLILAGSVQLFRDPISPESSDNRSSHKFYIWFHVCSAFKMAPRHNRRTLRLPDKMVKQSYLCIRTAPASYLCSRANPLVGSGFLLSSEPGL